MELLLVVALSLANEIRQENPSTFDELEQQPKVCAALISELENRIQGYELSDYVKAMAYAIKTSINENNNKLKNLN